jgi:hypothetical protein
MEFNRYICETIYLVLSDSLLCLFLEKYEWQCIYLVFTIFIGNMLLYIFLDYFIEHLIQFIHMYRVIYFNGYCLLGIQSSNTHNVIDDKF